ncbi:MAG: DUF5995 family protein, partial [Halobacteriales archaeon]|nr:DUF5995 family protein [Halobacteriales archaeon]
DAFERRDDRRAVFLTIYSRVTGEIADRIARGDFTDTEWVPAKGTGTVYTYSVAERMSGWPTEHLPLVVTYVELAEGPRMLTTIANTDPEAVTVGMAVAVAFEPTEQDDIAIPMFVPAAD